MCVFEYKNTKTTHRGAKLILQGEASCGFRLKGLTKIWWHPFSFDESPLLSRCCLFPPSQGEANYYHLLIGKHGEILQHVFILCYFRHPASLFTSSVWSAHEPR